MDKPKYLVKPDMSKPRLVFVGKRLAFSSPSLLRDRLVALGEHWAQQGYLVVTGNSPGSEELVARGVNRVNPACLEAYLPWDHYHPDKLVEGNRVMTVRRATLQDRKTAQACLSSWSIFSKAVRDSRVRFAQMMHGAAMVQAVPSYNKPGWGVVGDAIRIAWHMGITVFDALEDRRLDPDPKLIQVETH
uniref:DUF2493 domain-containing protein n=1 Tax=viral metagenome TaxID=1070528 RepID=A0A6H1Z8Z9_9ZZZZ